MTTRLIGMSKETALELINQLQNATRDPAQTVLLVTSDSEPVKSHFEQMSMGIEPSDYDPRALEIPEGLYVGPVFVMSYALPEAVLYHNLGFEVEFDE